MTSGTAIAPPNCAQTAATAMSARGIARRIDRIVACAPMMSACCRRRASRVLEQFMVRPPRLAVYLDDMRKVFLRLAVSIVHLRALAPGVAVRRRACAGVIEG